MSLTIYPTTDYDTFCLVTDADSILTLNVPSTQRTSWDALAEADKEIYLRQASEMIALRITLPSDLETDLQKATAYLANYSVGKVMTSDDGSGNLKRKNVAQTTIEKEYFAPGKNSNAFPTNVIMLLQQYGYVGGSNTFKLERA